MSKDRTKRSSPGARKARPQLFPPFGKATAEETRRFHLLLLLAAVVYCLSLNLVTIGDTDDQLMLTSAISFSETGKFLVPSRFATKEFHGFLFGAATASGEVYSKYPPGYSLVLLLFLPPAALAGKLFGSIGPEIVLSLPSVLALLATMLLIWRASLRLGYGAPVARLLALAYGLGSFAWGYAGTNYNEPYQALCAAAAFYGLLAMQQEPGHWRAYALAGGLALGFGILLRPYFGILAPAMVLGAFFLGHRELGLRGASFRAALFASPALIASAYLLGTNLVIFGSAANFGYKNEFFDTPFLTGFYGLLLGPRKGLLWFFPLAAIVPWSAWKLARSGRAWEVAVLSAATASQIFLISKWWGFESGRAWGDRLILAIVPFVVLLAGGIARSPRARKVAWTLVILGVAVNSLGILVNRMAYELIHQSAAVPRVAGEPRTGQLPGHLWLLAVEAGRPWYRPAESNPLWKKPPWIRKYPQSVPPPYRDAGNPILNPWPLRLSLPETEWKRREYGYQRSLLEVAIMRYEQGNLQRSLALLDRGLALNPRSAEFLAAKGMVLLRGGDTARALGFFDRSIQISPQYDLGLYGRGIIMEATGNYGAARDAYLRLLAAPEGQLDHEEVRERLAKLPK